MCQGYSFSHITKSNEPYLVKLFNTSWERKKIPFFWVLNYTHRTPRKFWAYLYPATHTPDKTDFPLPCLSGRLQEHSTLLVSTVKTSITHELGDQLVQANSPKKKGTEAQKRKGLTKLLVLELRPEKKQKIKLNYLVGPQGDLIKGPKC